MIKEIEINEPEVYKKLYVIGDIHGEFSEIVHKIHEKGIKGSILFLCGDCGFGFEKEGYYKDLYERKLRKHLEEDQNLILCIRGNHDDPEYFDSERIDFDNLKTIPSNTLVKTLGRNILCIGGAVSEDKDYRLKNHYPWWEGEGIEKEEKEIQDRVDIILSHECPTSFEPPLIRSDEMSWEIWKDIKDSRDYLQKVKETYNPKRYFYGHHHQSFSGTSGKTIYIGLGINEIVEINEDLDNE